MREATMHQYIEKNYCKFKRKHQVQFFRKKVDFVFIDKDSKINAIELKLENWKNGLKQVDSNQLFAHFSYLGIWHEKIGRVPLEKFSKHGFGVLSINKNKVITILKPNESKIRIESYTDDIINSMEEC